MASIEEDLTVTFAQSLLMLQTRIVHHLLPELRASCFESCHITHAASYEAHATKRNAYGLPCCRL